MSAASVISVNGSAVRIGGLPDCMLGERLAFADGSAGWALRLEEDAVVAAVLARQHAVTAGTVAQTTGVLLETPCGPELLGRVVDPLGRPLDGLGPPAGPTRRLDAPAPSFTEIAPALEPLCTGVKILDCFYPMVWGQSRVIVGPPRTGKTSLALDAVTQQRNSEAVCVYAAVGQRREQLAAHVQRLRDAGALARTIVVATAPDDPPALRMLTPLAACSQAEWFAREQGRNTLCVFDDLNGTAAACQDLATQVGSLTRWARGRLETIGWLPRLLDRPGQLAAGGAVSALWIAEATAAAVAFLPGPLASYSSGQIVMDERRFAAGDRPAIDLDRSRGMGRALLPLMPWLRKALFWQVADHRDLTAFAQAGAELDQASRQQLAQGQRIRELLRQPTGQPLAPREQAVVLLAARGDHTRGIRRDHLAEYERELLAWLPPRYPALMQALLGRFDYRMAEGQAMDAAIAEFTRHFLAARPHAAALD